MLLYMNFNLGNGPRTYVHEDGREDHPLLKSDMENGEAQFSPDGKCHATRERVHLASARPINSEAYEDYLKGHYYSYSERIKGNASPTSSRRFKRTPPMLCLMRALPTLISPWVSRGAATCPQRRSSRKQKRQPQGH